ncbi:uncharacterized protein LOC133224858 [Neopsephotus bourkii]|uniref:uncharacterized protein LOC133224858 n=1 Tax=Neopsephotus bourkii TaxID=309878 RepID=UPI002AA4FBAC|nr:uncharacterized protein LOC133224858 [Neopsephotus bourkii]
MLPAATLGPDRALPVAATGAEGGGGRTGRSPPEATPPPQGHAPPEPWARGWFPVSVPESRSRFPVPIPDPDSRFPSVPPRAPPFVSPAPGAAALCPPPLPRAPPWRSGDGRRGRPGDNGAEGNREPHAGTGAMGQVLGFAHCKEAPSTASTTPDSTEGGPEEPEFPPELAAAPEPPEEEEEDEDGGTPPRTPPRELTFSYIAFGGGGSAPQTEPGPRCRRDPRRGRPPRLGSGPPSRGLDPNLGVRAPLKRPGDPPAPPEGRPEVGGGPEMEEPPMRPGMGEVWGGTDMGVPKGV